MIHRQDAEGAKKSKTVFIFSWRPSRNRLRRLPRQT